MPAQWDELAQLMQRRGLVPFMDLAYQGFGSSLDADAAAVRMVAERVPEALIAISFSKNLGLYRERVGALLVVSHDRDFLAAIGAQRELSLPALRPDPAKV